MFKALGGIVGSLFWGRDRVSRRRRPEVYGVEYDDGKGGAGYDYLAAVKELIAGRAHRAKGGVGLLGGIGGVAMSFGRGRARGIVNSSSLFPSFGGNITPEPSFMPKFSSLMEDK